MSMMMVPKNVPIEVSDRGVKGVATFLQDQTSPTLSLPFIKERAVTTLAIDAVADGLNRVITLSSGHGALVGSILELADATNSPLYMQSKILAVAGDVITLDQPINKPYLALNTVVLVSDISMEIDGSITPQIFSVEPLPTQSGDMIRVVFEIRDDDDMDFTTFGGLAGLTNGCVLRTNKGDGTYKNHFNFKSNGDLLEQCYDGTFLLPKTGSSTKGFISRLTWGGQDKHGSAVRLDGAKGESLELVIQDNLTGLIRFHVTAQGHEVQGGSL